MERRILKILYIGTLPPHPGGSGISGYQLLGGFAGLGHTVRALAPVTPATQNLGRKFDSAHASINVTRFEVPHFEIPPYFPYPDACMRVEQAAVESAFAGLVAQDRPDVVLIGRETYARYVPQISHTHNLPCSLIIHGGLTHGIIDGTHPLESAQQLLAEYRKVDLLITPAEHMAANLGRLGVTTLVIPNAVNTEMFSPAQNGAVFRSTLADEHDIVVTYAGHLRPLKRSLDLVQVAETALRQNPRLMFVIVGDGPLRNVMEDNCRQMNIIGRFRFTGWVEHHSVPAYINAADIVITPTAIENQALIYLEAQACGRLLLATDIPAAREVIKDGETGLLFRVGDVEDCAAKLLMAAADSSLRTAIGRKARAGVHSHALERIVASYLDAMHGIVKHK